MDNLLTRLTVSVIIPYPDPASRSFLCVLNAKDEKWCLPAGKVEGFESLPQTGARENFEETDTVAVVDYLIGVYRFRSEHGNPVMNFVYAGTLIEGVPQAVKAEKIHEVRAFSLRELRDLESKGMIRAGRANVEPVEDYIKGKRLPDDAIRTYF